MGPADGGRQLADEVQDLVGGGKHLLLGVAPAVVVDVVGAVAIVGHDGAGHGEAARRRVGQPVEPPQHGAVAQVEVRCHIHKYAAHASNIVISFAQ